MKQELEVLNRDKRTADALTESELAAFYTALFKRIQQLANSGK